MTDRKEEIKNYLQNKVNPILKPMVEEISQARPANIMEFILQYAQRHLTQQSEIKLTANEAGSEEEVMTKEQEDQFAHKVPEKTQRKNGKKDSRRGISAEVFGDYNQKSAFTPQVYPKSKESS